MSLHHIEKGLARDKEIHAAMMQAAWAMCPAYRLVGYKNGEVPCKACQKQAARAVMAFYAGLPDGSPIGQVEVRPVAMSVVNTP